MLRQLYYKYLFNRLKGTRWKAGVLIEGDPLPHEVTSYHGGMWRLQDGRLVSIKQIRTMDILRHMCGYD